jgi:prepilin peptidase CpaA
MAAQVVAVVVSAVACGWDLRTRRIPNALTASAMLAGAAFHLLAPEGRGPAFWALGLLAGGVVFLPVFVLGGLGAGDVKLMAALGSWLGWAMVLKVALFTALAGGVLALVVALAHGYLRTAFRNLWALLTHWRVMGVRPMPELTLERGTGPRLPYAVPILVGLGVTLWRQ